MTESQVQWMKAADALAAMTAVYGNSRDMKAWLADALRDERLSARASKSWISESSKMVFSAPESLDGVERDVIIPVKYWRQSKTWLADQEKWRWPVNQAVVTLSRRPTKRRMFRGLEFLKADVDRLLRVPGVASDAKRGPKTAADKWGYVAAKLVEMELAGELNPALGLTANAIADRLKETTNELFGETYLYQFSVAFLKSCNRRK